jgi:hypothetical protein
MVEMQLVDPTRTRGGGHHMSDALKFLGLPNFFSLLIGSFTILVITTLLFRYLQGADSDEAAQAFRFDGAQCSDLKAPRARSLAG